MKLREWDVDSLHVQRAGGSPSPLAPLMAKSDGPDGE